jgi:hypothetical protein
MPETKEFLPFEAETQQQIIALLLQRPTLFAKYPTIWKADYFKGGLEQQIVRSFLRLKNGRPQEIVTSELLWARIQLDCRNAPAHYFHDLRNLLDKFWMLRVTNPDALERMAVEWTQDQAYAAGILEMTDRIQKGKRQQVLNKIIETYKVICEPQQLVNGVQFEAHEPTRPVEVIQGLLSVGEMKFITAESKAGKSLLLMDELMSVAAGLSWLGFDTVQTPVLYVNLEVSKREFWERYIAIRTAKGLSSAQLELFYPCCLDEEMFDIENFTMYLEAFCAGKKFSIVAIDSFYNLLMLYMDKYPRLGEDGESFIKLFKELKAIRAITGGAIICTHHFPKGNPGEKAYWDRYSGSGFLLRFANTLMSMTRSKDNTDGKLRTYVMETITRRKPIPTFGLRGKGLLYERDDSLMLEGVAGEPKGNKQYSEKEFFALLPGTGLGYGDWFELAHTNFGVTDSTFKTYIATMMRWNWVAKEGGHRGLYVPKNENLHKELLERWASRTKGESHAGSAD